MTKKKQIERKKKQRERRAKDRVLARRGAALAKRRKEKKLIELDEKTSLGKKYKPTPIRNNRANEMKRQLEHNAQILKALEEELVKELSARENLNEELEREGYNSLEEKVKALTAKAREAAGCVTPEDLFE